MRGLTAARSAEDFFLIPSKLYFFVYLWRLAPLFSVRGLRLGAGVSSDLILVSFLGFDLFLIFNLFSFLFPLPFNSFYSLSILFSPVLLVKRGSRRRSSA